MRHLNSCNGFSFADHFPVWKVERPARHETRQTLPCSSRPALRGSKRRPTIQNSRDNFLHASALTMSRKHFQAAWTWASAAKECRRRRIHRGLARLRQQQLAWRLASALETVNSTAGSTAASRGHSLLAGLRASLAVLSQPRRAGHHARAARGRRRGLLRRRVRW